MTTRTAIFLGAALLAGALGVGHAQAQYPAYPGYAPPPTPPAWSYDPYTSGLAGCPQYRHGDLVRCRDQMPPTYGQPSYWSQ